MRKEFERSTPESVGIPSGSIEWLLDRLEEGWTEPHGLMIMKQDKVIAEGWWAPYAPGIVHGLQSHTKTYAATAVGIAIREGILSLDERIIDIFPEEAPEEPSENLRQLKVRHVLSMGCGMDEMPKDSVHWVKDFLQIPVNHTPGTAFMYNSMGSTLLCSMIRKKTGLGLIDYLTPRLFDKIGIDPSHLKCMKMADGIEMGGGGLFATTEDNLRLMKLYLDGGCAGSERILSEEYVRLATTLQNESYTERAVNPPAEDNFVGYGYQIWMCRRPGIYRADGAMGQFTIVFPKEKMILAITENASGSTGGVIPQRVLDTIWEWYDSLPESVALPEGTPLPEDPSASGHLKNRMERLALPRPATSRPSALQQELCSREFRQQEGSFFLKYENFFEVPNPNDIFTSFSISFEQDSLIINGTSADGKTYFLKAAMDGSRKENLVPGLAGRALASACWLSDSLLRLTLRMVETCNEQYYDFNFTEDQVLIESYSNHTFSQGQKKKALYAC